MFGFSFSFFYSFLWFVIIVSLAVTLPVVTAISFFYLIWFISLLLYYFSVSHFRLFTWRVLFISLCETPYREIISLPMCPSMIRNTRNVFIEIFIAENRFFSSDVFSGCWSLNWMLHDAVVFADHCVIHHKWNWARADKNPLTSGLILLIARETIWFCSI